MIKVLVADDHEVVRRGLKQIISETNDIVVAAEAGDGREVLEKIRKERFDVILLDISMPGRNGLDILSRIKEDYPDLPVLILTMYPEEQFAVRSLKAGASGYLTKESAPTELVSAIRKVYQRGKYITASLAEQLASILDITSKKLSHEMLSDREFQVMQMIASGKGLKEIADELALSSKTISTYRTRILEKMNMKNNSDIIRYAIENKLMG